MGFDSAEILNNLFTLYLIYLHKICKNLVLMWCHSADTHTCLWHASVLYDADDPGLPCVILCFLQVKGVTHCIDQLSDTDEAIL